MSWFWEHRAGGRSSQLRFFRGGCGTIALHSLHLPCLLFIINLLRHLHCLEQYGRRVQACKFEILFFVAIGTTVPVEVRDRFSSMVSGH
jgi:hypothetical protein